MIWTANFDQNLQDFVYMGTLYSLLLKVKMFIKNCKTKCREKVCSACYTCNSTCFLVSILLSTDGLAIMITNLVFHTQGQ